MMLDRHKSVQHIVDPSWTHYGKPRAANIPRYNISWTHRGHIMDALWKCGKTSESEKEIKKCFKTKEITQNKKKSLKIQHVKRVVVI